MRIKMNKHQLTEVFKNLFENEEVEKKDKTNIAQEVSEIFEKASKMPTNWSNIFSSIEEFRNDLLSDDKQDSSATESQMALTIPLIAYFILVLETDLLMPPEETRIIINLISDNFTKPNQLQKLKDFLNIMHPNKF
tara:strand:- start:1115 stop:1522 length:408 start_codon:yes stop_codon:yes gene_type:complete